jgi:hypothetical protein
VKSAELRGDGPESHGVLAGRSLYRARDGSDELVILAAACAVVTLPSSTPRRIYSRVLAQLGAPGVSTETVVQSIPLLGVDSVDSFSLVLIEPEEVGKPSSVTVVVRGEAAVDVHCPGGSARVFAEGLVPWRLVTFRSVGAVVVGILPEIPNAAASFAGPGLPLGTGAVRGRRGVWHIDRELSIAEPIARAIDRAPVDLSAFEATRIVLPAEVAVSPPAYRSDPEFRGFLPGTGQPGKRFQIRLGDGDPIELAQPIVVGRNPRPPRLPTGQARTMLRVESGSSRVSGSHIEIARVGDSVVVTDLASTNGTTVTLPDGSQIKLRQGDSLVTPVRSMIDVGDGNVIEVLQKSM